MSIIHWLRHRWALAAVVLLGGGLRFATLGHQSFWEDEALTAWQMHLPLGRLVSDFPHVEASPPLYFGLAWLWTRLFGAGEAGLRSLSALAGTLTIPVVFLCGRSLASARAGLLAALLVALSPSLVWYSQEARPYGVMVLLVACSLLFFLRALLATGPGRRRELQGWAITSCLAMATHYFAWFVVATEAAWLLSDAVRRGRPGADRRPLRDVARPFAGPLLAVAGAAVLLLPLLVYQRVSGGGSDLGFIGDDPLLDRLKDAGAEFVYGAARPDGRTPLTAAELLAGAAVAFALLRGSGLERRRMAVPLVVGGLIVSEAVLLDALGLHYVDQRNLLPALVPLLVGVAVAMAVRGGRLIGAALAALAAALSLAILTAVYVEPAVQREDWRDAARALGSAHVARAIVIAPDLTNPRPVPPLVTLEGHYRKSVRRMPRVGASVAEIDVLDVRGSPSDVAPVASPRSPAPGFRLVAHHTNGNYNLFRFVAAKPVHVDAHALMAEHLLARDTSIALQRPG